MKLLPILILCAAFAAIAAPATTPAASVDSVPERVTPTVREEIVAAIDAWRAAVVGKDRAGLERAYHLDLSYGHSGGEILARAAQIERTLRADSEFTRVDVADLAVRAYGDVACVTATYTFHVRTRDGEIRVATLPSLDVWTRGPSGWQLIARQLVRKDS